MNKSEKMFDELGYKKDKYSLYINEDVALEIGFGSDYVSICDLETGDGLCVGFEAIKTIYETIKEKENE